MLILAAALAALMGVVLGLLGGGGSILAVPILVYVLGVAPKAAIATSLLVVGVTAAVGVVAHLRSGRVKWRIGLIFGSVAMVGAWLGSRAAAWIPAGVLLGLFAVVMLAAAIAMLRPRPELTARPGGAAWYKIALEGLAVGGVTGLVGAGGGFLVVPALVVLGGLPMADAVATSLLVIALKSSAGVVGYLAHVAIDWQLAVVMALAAGIGTPFGARLVARIPAPRLRRIFAVFVLLAGVSILWRETPPLPSAVRSGAGELVVWSGWLGGIAVGLYAVVQVWLSGKPLGVSAGFGTLCGLPRTRGFFRRGKYADRFGWRLWFVLGIPLGGLIATLTSPGVTWAPTLSMGAMYDAVLPASLSGRVAWLLGGGALVGYGARLAGGCTSGHSISGLAMLNPPSVLASIGFFVGGIAAVQVLFAVAV